MKIIPVIISGGAGTRLWPVSRHAHPKPFMNIGGHSLFQQAVLRGLACGVQDILIVTNQDHLYLSLDEIKKLQTSSTDAPHFNTQFLLETQGRNTAPAIALAAFAVRQHYGAEAVMLVLPADHLVPDVESFAADAYEAAQQALQKEGTLVTFGIAPTAPETGFGYIEVAQIGRKPQAALRFVEKPNAQTAQEYLATGRYYWNSGMFCFQAGSFLEALKTHALQVHDSAALNWEKAKHQTEQGCAVTRFNTVLFAQQPDISIDYAVMEKADRVTLIPARFAWSDVGSWPAVAEALTADSSGNTCVTEQSFAATEGHETHLAINTRNTHVQIHSHTSKLIATVGVEDLVIVDTPDALLVANKGKAQQVKAVVDLLKQRKHDSTHLPATVHRPWGTYANLKEEEGYKVKRISVKPGQSLSLQYHHQRAEHWVVVSGEGIVQIGDVEHPTRPGQYRYIPLKEKHRLTNTGSTELVLIEVQCGEYLDEDDIVRLSDNYGRAA